MKTTIKAFLHWHKYDWQEEFEFRLMSSDMTKVSPEWVLIREMDIVTDIPDDFDPRPYQVAALREKKKEVLAKAHVQVSNIEEQIQQLLALEDMR